MILLFDAALEIQSFFEHHNKPFCFIGGIAVLQWGEVRVTNDLDLALFCGYGNEEELIDLLLASFSPRISNAKNFALVNRVLLLNSSKNIPLDITLTGLEFEELMIQRSVKQMFISGYNLSVCIPEDLIVMKAFADRPKDWADIEGIILRQHGKLNKKLILDNLAPLSAIKGDSAIIQNLKKFLI